jgi:hypothetical protein
MLRLDKVGKSLRRLQTEKLADAGFLERTHLQQITGARLPGRVAIAAPATASASVCHFAQSTTPTSPPPIPKRCWPVRRSELEGESVGAMTT